jgi:virulence factor Mce-like protein
MHPLAIAALVIVAATGVTFYAFNQALPFRHPMTLYALVNNSVNVRGGSPVRIAGIDVGVVRDVAPAGTASKVAFTVEPSGLPVHRDATVRIRDRLFLEGSYYLELDPGTPSAPVMHSGEEIPLSRTSSPVQFYTVLSTFDVAARTSFQNLLNTLDRGFSASAGRPVWEGGAGALKRAVPEFTPVLKDTAWVTRSLRGTHPGDVETLLRSTAEVMGTVAQNSGALAGLVGGLNATSSALASADGALARSVSGLDQTLQGAPAELSAIDHALPPVAKLAMALTPSLAVSPPILDRITSTVQQLAAALAPLQREQLLASLKATFEQFPALLTQLTRAFPLTRQITDCLKTHVIPVLSQTVPDGSLSTGLPVWQDFMHFLPGVAGATGSFDANGPYTRVVAGAGTNSVTTGPLPNLPLLGPIVGTPPPGNSQLLGARPSWIGDQTAADFHPEAPCATQRVPSLAAPAASPDLRSQKSSPPKPLSADALRALLGPAAGRKAR